MRTRSNLGSSLLLVVLLLLALSIIGVAAVAVSSQERTNASAKGRYDRLVACASAAQGKLWAELARYGPSYMAATTPVTTVNLPDGSTVTAPGHYGATDSLPTPKSVVVTLVGAAGGAGAAAGSGDLTNGASGMLPPGAGANIFVATCKDAQGNEYEVEFAVRFAL